MYNLYIPSTWSFLYLGNFFPILQLGKNYTFWHDLLIYIVLEYLSDTLLLNNSFILNNYTVHCTKFTCTQYASFLCWLRTRYIYRRYPAAFVVQCPLNKNHINVLSIYTVVTEPQKKKKMGNACKVVFAFWTIKQERSEKFLVEL
jgi:hypothetical protein